MKYNKPLTAAGLSIVGGVPAEIFTILMKHYHYTSITTAEALSMMYMRQPSMSLGVLAMIGTSAILGLIVYYSAKILGTKYFPVKCAIMIMFAESIIFIIFGNLIRNELMIQNTAGNYVHAGAAALSGLFKGFLFAKYIFKG